MSCIAGGFFPRGEGWSFPSSFAQAQTWWVRKEEAGWQASRADRDRTPPHGTFGMEFAVFAHSCPALGMGTGVSHGSSLGGEGCVHVSS